MPEARRSVGIAQAAPREESGAACVTPMREPAGSRALVRAGSAGLADLDGLHSGLCLGAALIDLVAADDDRARGRGPLLDDLTLLRRGVLHDPEIGKGRRGERGNKNASREKLHVHLGFLLETTPSFITVYEKVSSHPM